jgi:hypothetical protein
LLVAVYRERNASLVRDVVDQALAESWDVRLWALDSCEAELASYTRETGPTARLAALNQLATGYEPHDAEWIVLSDDDVAVPPGGLRALVGLCSRAEVTLAQPAQDARGFPSHPFTLARPFSILRETRFVETGPMVCVRRSWWETLIEPCVGMGMGWGAEVLWSDQRRAGARLAIVDAVLIRHLFPTGEHYSQTAEKERLRRLLDERGLPSLAALQTTVATWRPWQRQPLGSGPAP